MIPKITQEAPNIVQRYWCSTCGRSLPAPDQHDDQWRFCPRCGEPIEYEKAEPVQWREQNCEKCNVGQLLGAGVIISSSLSLYYAPVMLVLGLVMGALTSVTLRALLPALGKMGFNTHENRPE